LRSWSKGWMLPFSSTTFESAPDIPLSFPETEDAEIITIKVKGILKVTKVIAPAMVTRGRSLILIMGAFGGFLPTPPRFWIPTPAPRRSCSIVSLPSALS
jgi:hypothetical protein